MPNVKCPKCGEIDWRTKDAYGNYNCQNCGCKWGKRPRKKSKWKKYGEVNLAPVGQSNIQDTIFGRSRR